MNRYPVALCAAVAFGLLTGGASSCGSTDTTNTSDKPSPSQSSAPSDTPAAAPKVPAKPQYYRGAGTKNLGTILVPVDSTVTWTNGKTLGSADNFVVTNDFNDANTFDINAIGTHDTSQVSAGTYHKVSVIGTNWTMKIVPNK